MILEKLPLWFASPKVRHENAFNQIWFALSENPLKPLRIKDFMVAKCGQEILLFMLQCRTDLCMFVGQSFPCPGRSAKEPCENMLLFDRNAFVC
jgi:hypothetical protein